ncbi:13201_t:CDS:2, partial [Cetraspora pellucida]
RQKFSHISSQYQENFNTNLYILKRDISKDLEDVGIDSSKESNNLKEINLDFLEESDYNQENNNNFSEEFINIQHFRSWRHNLPLIPIYSRTINISAKKTSSNSKNTKDAYYLSINNIIWHILNNSTLIKHIYFGSDQEVTNKSEY